MSTLALALCLAGCGGGGGGGGGGVVSAEFASASSESPETGGSVTVEIVLRVPGGTLLEDVEFYVADLGTGSAVAGDDYVPLGALTVTFPAGAQDGDRMTVSWTPMDDGNSEGNETLILQLMPVGQAVVAGRTQITATILDDESSTLLVEEGARGGTLLPLGATMPLGNQTIGIPTTTGIDVWLDNIGVTPLRISAPTLVAGDVADFVIETPVELGSTAVAASPPVDAAFPLVVPAAATSGGAQSLPLVLRPELLAKLEPLDRVVLRDVPLPGAAPVDLVLERVPSPVRPGAVLAVDGGEISGGIDAVAAPSSSWSGHIDGDPGSRVFLSFSEAGSRGWIRPGDEDAEPLHLLAGATWSAPASLVQNSVFQGPSTSSPAEVCLGAPEIPGNELGGIAPAATVDGGSHVPYVCRLALETDYQLFAKFGDATLLTDYVVDLVSAVSDRFQNDIATSFQIVYLGIHTTPADPWDAPDGGGTVAGLLDEFQAAWAPVYGGSWPVSADLGHLLSGGLGGGMSYIDVLCNPDYAFGVSTGLTANVDWSSYSGGTSALYWDFDVLAHELGHAFNARHTHEYCPPLDTCALSCQGQLCGRGTIMSYCHSCPGGVANVDLVFHPRIANEMRLAVNNSCLAEATLASGDATFFRLYFRPTGAPGPRTATLEFTHDASSSVSPYRVTLIGVAE